MSKQQTRDAQLGKVMTHVHKNKETGNFELVFEDGTTSPFEECEDDVRMECGMSVQSIDSAAIGSPGNQPNIAPRSEN